MNDIEYDFMLCDIHRSLYAFYLDILYNFATSFTDKEKWIDLLKNLRRKGKECSEKCKDCNHLNHKKEVS